MSETKPNNPSLFEVFDRVMNDLKVMEPYTAITLRDIFAACALSHMAHPQHNGNTEMVAEFAYQVADDMLAVRERPR